MKSVMIKYFCDLYEETINKTNKKISKYTF